MAQIVGKVIPADGSYTEGHRILLEDANFDIAPDGETIETAGGGGGGLGSVGVTMPADFVVTNSPLTADGDIDVDYASQPANLMLASPDGAAGVPSFRAIVGDDLPLATATKKGAMPPLSNNSNQFLNGAGNWATPAGGGSSTTVYSMSDDPVHADWTPLVIQTITPTPIPQLSNIPLAAGSIYEVEVLLLVSNSVPTDGIQIQAVTNHTDENYGMQVILNTSTTSASATMAIDQNTGNHPLVSATPPVVNVIRAQGIINTIGANMLGINIFCETGSGNIALWTALMKLTQHRSNMPQM